MSVRRLLVLADIGGARDLHVGDEAMLAANVARLRRIFPDVRLALISRDPAYSAQQYQADALRPFGFSDDPARESERLALLDRIRVARPDDTVHALAAAVASADGVFISGGGNLSSSWPHHLYERVALLECARAAGIPAIVTGQTLGPALTPAHRALLAQALQSAALVGLRERPSYKLALDLGLAPDRLVYQTDDALFLEDAPFSVPELPGAPFIAVTLHPMAHAFGGRRVYKALAGQFDALVQETGCALVFIPHVGETNGRPDLSDGVMGEEVRLRMKTPLHLLPLLVPAQAVWATRQAAMILSSRYHPLVFGLSAARPGLGLTSGDYTAIKLGGALHHAGLDEWLLPLPAAFERKRLFERARALWRAREAVQARIAAHLPRWREDERRFEQRLEDALRGQPPSA